MAHALQYHHAQVSTASGLDVLAGVWLLISPLALMVHSNSFATNNVILGIIIGGLALVRFFERSHDTVWMSWLNVLLGIWVLISPWALGFGQVHTAVLNNVVMGIIVIVLACWSGLATTNSKEQDHGDTMSPSM